MKVVYLHEFVEKYLAHDKPVRQQIWNKLKEFARSEAGSYPHEALRGSQFRGLFKLRAGDWRLIYQIRGDEVCFITLGHRSEAYR